MNYSADVLKPDSSFGIYVLGLFNVVTKAPFTENEKSTTTKDLNAMIMEV